MSSWERLPKGRCADALIHKWVFMVTSKADEVFVGGQVKSQCAVARNFFVHKCSSVPACKKTPWARKNGVKASEDGVKIIESCTSNQAALYAEESLIEKRMKGTWRDPFNPTRR